MAAVIQDPHTPGSVLQAIAALADQAVTDIRIAVAYVTEPGARLLLAQLELSIGTERWASTSKTLITSFDFGYTEPNAIRVLWDHGFETRVAHTSVGESIESQAGTAWHPKLYVLCTSAERRAFVGSANLSRRAMTVNTEIGSMIYEAPAESLDDVWAQLVPFSSIIDAQTLATYEGKRPPRPMEGFRPRHSDPELPEPVEQVFGQAVLEGAIDPAHFVCLWVESSGMSGGSQAQLELPRFANRYFGFSFEQHDGHQRVIGDVEIVIGQSRWERRLAWHGDNGMERLNLPTLKMVHDAGEPPIVWGHKVILLRRLAEDSFAVTVAEPDSQTATNWRQESAASQNIFRLGSNSPRICGLL